ncbi:MAG: hypothetical protein GKS06_00565 [Acidobacteria bacterium]|nr:hypothetical protein [Acidobacteriota bacterium]
MELLVKERLLFERRRVLDSDGREMGEINYHPYDHREFNARWSMTIDGTSAQFTSGTVKPAKLLPISWARLEIEGRVVAEAMAPPKFAKVHVDIDALGRSLVMRSEPGWGVFKTNELLENGAKIGHADGGWKKCRISLPDDMPLWFAGWMYCLHSGFARRLR